LPNPLSNEIPQRFREIIEEEYVVFQGEEEKRQEILFNDRLRREELYNFQRQRKSSMGVEIYVGQLSGTVTENEVSKLFSVVGTVESIHMVKDAETGTFRGCGYVRMSTEDEARDAVNLMNGAMLGGRLITVKMSVKQNERKAGQSGSGPKGKGSR